MAHFTGAGVIATDIVRKETRRGILATFRLASGQAGKGQVWIDVEAWGNLAGTIHHHGSEGRGVIVGGRLTQKTWRDRADSSSRHRYVITANDIDLLPSDLRTANGIDCPNHVTSPGRSSQLPLHDQREQAPSPSSPSPAGGREQRPAVCGSPYTSGNPNNRRQWPTESLW